MHKRAFRNNKSYSYDSDEVFTPNHEAVKEGPGVKSVWITPTPQLIRGDVERWAQESGVQCVRVPGYWFEKKASNIAPGASPQNGEKVIFSLHGGAYAKLSAHPDDLLSTIRHGLLEHTHTINRLLNLEYRLSRRASGKPVNPFPAALLDAIAGYNYLVNEVGFSPKDIIVLGDSAGGNLALALVRYLVERRTSGDTDVPDVPSALLLLSPWADLEVREHGPGSSALRNRDSDYVDLTGGDMVTATSFFLGSRSFDETRSNRYISPASQSPAMGQVSFAGFPRTLIINGGAESLQDQIHVLRKKMAADVGVENVQLLEFPDAIHDFCAFTWHEPERTEALKMAAKWMEL